MEFHTLFSNTSEFSIITCLSNYFGDVCIHKAEGRIPFVSKLSTSGLSYMKKCDMPLSVNSVYLLSPIVCQPGIYKFLYNHASNTTMLH